MYIYKNIISIEEGKKGGKPCIREMRITVENILGWLTSGMSVEEILQNFPELTHEDIDAALEFSVKSHKINQNMSLETRKALMQYFSKALQKDLNQGLEQGKYQSQDFEEMLKGKDGRT